MFYWMIHSPAQAGVILIIAAALAAVLCLTR